MVSPTERVLVVGDGAIAEALSRVLDVLGLHSRHTGHSTLTDTTRIADCKRLLGLAGNNGLDCPTLIVLMGSGGLPGEAVRLVHRLRSGFLWEGKLLLVVPSSKDASIVGATSLCGVDDSETRIENLHGHAVLRWPILLPDLLRRFIEMEPMFTEEWWRVEQACGVRRISRSLSDAEAALNAGDQAVASRSLDEAVRELGTFNWRLFVSHRCESEIEQLLKDYTGSGTMDHRSCAVVLKTLRRCLSGEL